jgi:hypothetical protein
MSKITYRFFALSTLLLCAVLLAGCPTKDHNPIPPAGTNVTSTSEIFKRTAVDLENHCAAIGGCTCFMDGIQTTCAVVFACLDAGFCERVE